MIETNYIPLVFISDDDYAIPSSVAASSVVNSKNSDTELLIYILTDGLSEKSKAAFESLCSDSVEVKVITADISKYENIHHGVENSYCQATVTALMKFDIPNLIPERKIIYLDGDILCRGDLSELYNTDLEGNMLGAVMDSGRIYSGREFVLEHPSYFNSGVMLMDLDAMRNCDAGSQLYEIKNNMAESQLMDQDVLNIFFRDSVKLLPIRYNFLYVNLLRAQQQNKLEINKVNDLFATNYRSLSLALEDSVIVHFASKNKPWKDIGAPLHDEWMKMFEKSPVCHEKDYISAMQYQWLYSEYRSLHKELSRTKKEVNNIYWRREYNNIFNSVSFRIGRTITALPRFCRDKLEKRKTPQESDTAAVIPAPVIRSVNDKLTVSMTSYGPRLKTAHIAVESILKQTLKPDRIVICIADDDYSKLTPQLKKMERKGRIEILKRQGLDSPHKKYFFTMQSYPDDIIITVDDDVIYRADLIEKLYSAYKQFPDCVAAMRVHRIRFTEEGGLMPYNQWKMRSSEYVLTPRNDLFATGVGGVLYPPHLLYADVFRRDIIEQTCLKADDVWLKVMELLGGVRVVQAAPNQTLQYIDDTQEMGLFNSNVNCCANDDQLNSLFEYYGRERLLEMIADNR